QRTSRLAVFAAAKPDTHSCRTPTLCPPKSTVCTTTLHSVETGYPFFGNITVTRSCEEECLSYDGIGATRPKSCCYTDLCTDDTKSSNGVALCNVTSVHAPAKTPPLLSQPSCLVNS
uniref:Snake toxin/toxin-like domain-containing protein n=1 Tax=Otus sunia TaxID=257818 RepID=A0A8C8AKT7_9STRI